MTRIYITQPSTFLSFIFCVVRMHLHTFINFYVFYLFQCLPIFIYLKCRMTGYRGKKERQRWRLIFFFPSTASHLKCLQQQLPSWAGRIWNTCIISCCLSDVTAGCRIRSGTAVIQPDTLNVEYMLVCFLSFFLPSFSSFLLFFHYFPSRFNY